MNDDWLPGERDDDPDPQSPEGLLTLLNAQAAILVSVSTGGPKIESVNARYIKRRRKLNAALRARGIEAPFPYADLWEWYGYYSQHITGYGPRRTFIAELAAPARQSLELAMEGSQVSDPGGGEVSWPALDVRVEGVVAELRDATSRDDLQDVGRRCREILIDTARLLADPALVPKGTEVPFAGDAKAWLKLFLKAGASGRSHEELRAFIPVAWDLAQKVTHGDIERVDAYAAAQATVLVVRTLQQLA
jgi:hypothetical protein